jgi:hypothetical protein
MAWIQRLLLRILTALKAGFVRMSVRYRTGIRPKAVAPPSALLLLMEDKCRIQTPTVR